MVRSSDSGSLSVAPFLKKCYEMVDDESTNSIISWSQSNDSFVICDMTEFSVQLLPKYFKHRNSSSFIRQLNIYGFRKVDTDRWEFANDGFIRGQKHLLKNICRRKNSQGTDNRKSLQQQDNSVETCEKVDNEVLWKEVENLKTDKNALMQELVKLRQYQESADNKLLLLRDRLQGMEKNQQQMLSFLVMAVQSPGFLVQLVHKKENSWRMAEPGSIVEQGADDAEPLVSDGIIVRYQLQMDEMSTPTHAPPVGFEKPQESNTSSDGMKDFFMSPDFMKVLMDENLCSFENHAAFVLPESVDDSAWEQLLLASPFLDNIDETKQESKKPTNAEVEMETTLPGTHLDRTQNFELLIEQMEKSQNLENNSTNHGASSDKSQNLEILTKQMGLLASETNHKQDLQ